MPTIRKRFTATTEDALQQVKFSDIGGNGAIINVWAACGTAGDEVGLAIGNQDIVAQNTRPNVESAAGVIDVLRDKIVDNELVPPGHLYFAINAVTTEVLLQVMIRYV